MSPTSILIIAHAPLAHALRECALHVFADCGSSVAALDVQPNQPPKNRWPRRASCWTNWAPTPPWC